MIGKELVVINNIGRFFSDLKIHLLLARYRIKQTQIQNIGFHNASSKLLSNFFWKNLTFKLNKYYGHKLIVLLSDLRLVPKIQIKFTSISETMDFINKSFVKKILFKEIW